MTICENLAFFVGKNESFLSVTTDNTSIQERKGYMAMWVINITSFPASVDYVWTDGNNMEIGRDPKDTKYRIEKKNSVVKLKILSASLKDFGAYKFTVRLKNTNKTETLNLHLTVFGKCI